MNLILNAKNISKTFHFPETTLILQDIDFALEKGSSVCIMGPSGEGKTTLLQILGTLLQPDSGSVYIDNECVTSKNTLQIRKEKIGFIFQSYYLLEDLTALENVILPDTTNYGHFGRAPTGNSLITWEEFTL